MATREENLKKINEELEKLDDEQLEQVAGGILKPSFTKRRKTANVYREIEDKPVANDNALSTIW